MMHDSPDVEWFETADGSLTLRERALDVTYRSTGGASTESRIVFVEGTYTKRPVRRVYELGFGGARNFLESVDHAERHGYRLEYFAVERAPLGPEWVVVHDHADLARRALAGVSGSRVEWPGGVLTLAITTWGDVGSRPDWIADSVYFDPFGPGIDASNWSVEAFEWARAHMRSDGLLGTYGASTAARRALVAAGFEVASAPGPGRKREITFASPCASTLTSRPELRLLKRSKYA